MTLKVIGTGFGRTGTLSMKAALNEIGFGPCYHMSEVFAAPEHSKLWHDAATDKPGAWRPILENYRSVVDWPTAYFYKELADAYPDAKILHTERDPIAWCKSITSTILSTLTLPPDLSVLPPARREHLLMTRYLIIEKTFGGDLSDANLIRVFNEHNARVKKEFAGPRLLVHDAKDGWEPLCRFLGVPVPSVPYPKTNTTDEFIARIASVRAGLSGAKP